eukprot:scaffold240721_cov14-Tisochrysis_lutea.AAC.1
MSQLVESTKGLPLYWAKGFDSTCLHTERARKGRRKGDSTAARQKEGEQKGKKWGERRWRAAPC